MKVIQFISLACTILSLVHCLNKCGGTNMISNLYPVQGETFYLPLGEFFNGNSLTYTTGNGFSVQSTTSTSNQKVNLGTDVVNIIQVVQQKLFSNPNLKTNNFALLTTTKTGYAVYTSIAGKPYVQIGKEIQINGITCNNIDFLTDNQILVNCNDNGNGGSGGGSGGGSHKTGGSHKSGGSHKKSEKIVEDSFLIEEELKQKQYFELSDLVEVDSQQILEQDENPNQEIFLGSHQQYDDECGDESDSNSSDRLYEMDLEQNQGKNQPDQIFYIFEIQQNENVYENPVTISVPMNISFQITSSQMRLSQNQNTSNLISLLLKANIYISYSSNTKQHGTSAFYQWSLNYSNYHDYNISNQKLPLPTNDPITDFYVTQNSQCQFFFYLMKNKGLFYNDQQISDICFASGYTALGVHENEEYENQQSYILAIASQRSISIFSLDPSNSTHNVTIHSTNIFPKQMRINSAATILMNDQFVYLSNGLAAALYPGPSFKSTSGYVFDQTFKTYTTFTFDPYHNVLTQLSLGSQNQVTFFQPYLTTQMNGLLQQGSVSVTGQNNVGKKCTLDFSWTLVSSDQKNIYTTVSEDQIKNGYLTAIYPSVAVEPLSQLFYGPNVEYNVEMDEDDESGNSFTIHQWVDQQSDSKTNEDYYYGANFVDPADGDFYYQFIQSQNKNNLLSITQYSIDKNSTSTSVSLSGQVQQVDVGFNSYSNQSYYGVVVKQSNILNIYELSNNKKLASINVTEYVASSIIQIISFKFVQNSVYIITDSPASLHVVSVANFSNIVHLYELSGYQYQPNKVYSQKDYGPLVFIDNTVNLLVLETSGNKYTILNTIEYNKQDFDQVVCIGLTSDGIYIAISGTELTFIPKSSLATNSNTQTSIPLLNYQQTAQCTSTNDLFFIILNDADNNYYLQAYDNQPSTYDAFYSQKNLSFTPQVLSSASVFHNEFDAILVLGNNNQWNTGLYTTAELELIPEFPEDGYNYTGTILLEASLKDTESNISINQTYSVINTEMFIKPQHKYNKTDKIIVKSQSNIFQFNPSNYFLGSIIDYAALCIENCEKALVQNVLFKPTQANGPLSPQASTIDLNQIIYVQTAQSLYKFVDQNFTLVSNFSDSDQVVNCPFMFTDIYTNYIVSICNTQNGIRSYIYNHETTTSSSSFLIQLYIYLVIDKITDLQNGEYLNGIVLLYVGTINIQLNQYFYQINSDNTQTYNLFTSTKLPTSSSYSFINISMGQNTQKQSVQSYAISFINNGVVTLQQFSVSQTSQRRRVLVTVDSSTQVIDVASIVGAKFTNISPNVLQVLQIGSVYTSSTGEQMLPILVMTDKWNYKIDFSLNQQGNSSYICPYTQYGNYITLPRGSAQIDKNIIIIPYQGPNNNNFTLGVYMNNDNCSQSNPNTLVGGYNLNGQSLDYIKTLSNGQVLVSNPLTSQALILQSNPYVTLNITPSTSSSSANLQFTAANYLAYQQVSFQVDGLNSHRSESKGLAWWIILLIVLGVLFIVGLGIGGYLYYKKYHGNEFSKTYLAI